MAGSSLVRLLLVHECDPGDEERPSRLEVTGRLIGVTLLLVAALAVAQHVQASWAASGSDIGIEIVADPLTMPSEPAVLGGPFTIQARTKLGVCVSDRTGAIPDAEKETALRAALGAIRIEKPDWTARQFTPPSVLLGLECPGASPFLRTDLDAADSGATMRIPASDRASRFSVFVYIVPPLTEARMYIDAPRSQRAIGQEVVCSSPQAHACPVVTYAVYTSPEGFRQRRSLQALLGGALAAGEAPPKAAPVRRP